MNRIVKESIEKNKAAALRLQEVSDRLLELLKSKKLIRNTELLEEVLEKMEFMYNTFRFIAEFMQKLASLPERHKLLELTGEDEDSDSNEKTIH